VRKRRLKVTGVAPTVTVGKYPKAIRELVFIVQSIPVDEATSCDATDPTHCVLVEVAVLAVGEEEVVDEPFVPPMRSVSEKVSLTKKVWACVADGNAKTAARVKAKQRERNCLEICSLRRRWVGIGGWWFRAYTAWVGRIPQVSKCDWSGRDYRGDAFSVTCTRNELQTVVKLRLEGFERENIRRGGGACAGKIGQKNALGWRKPKAERNQL